ncbi:MAG TPA: alpha/beta hydrolase [Solirubrobacterales bacterium]
MSVFCLIHGAWHEPSCWDELTPLLRQRGHRVLVPDLPLQDPEAGFDQRIRPALEAIDEIDGRLVIVGHSQGTAYSSLLAAARPDALLIHLCPRLGGIEPPPDSPEIFRHGIPFPEVRSDGTSVWDEEVALEALYRRVPPPRASMMAGRLRPMAMPRGEYPLSAHPDNETVLIYAADDELFHPDWERFMAHEQIGVEPIEIPGGHFPMVEDPDALAELLDRVATG